MIGTVLLNVQAGRDTSSIVYLLIPLRSKKKESPFFIAIVFPTRAAGYK